MRISFSSKKSLLVASVSGGVFLALLLLIFLNLSGGITDEEAGSRVIQYLRADISRHHMAELQGQGRRVPDRETALRWQKDYRQINDLKIGGIEIKRPIPDIIFHPHRPTYVVRIIFSREGQELPPRYFWLGWPRFDRETSPFFWYVSL